MGEGLKQSSALKLKDLLTYVPGTCRMESRRAMATPDLLQLHLLTSTPGASGPLPVQSAAVYHMQSYDVWWRSPAGFNMNSNIAVTVLTAVQMSWFQCFFMAEFECTDSRSDHIILHLFQPHQVDQMFDPQTDSSYVSKH